MAANSEEDEYWESQHAKSNRPGDTAFKQQRLSAWKPVVTVRSTIPVFAVIGVVFLVIGGILHGSVTAVKQIQVEYTNCVSQEYTGRMCSDIRANLSLVTEPCTCWVNFTLPEQYSGTVYMYYKLTDFYQNHRRYIKSRSDLQLRGSLASDGDCTPLKTAPFNATGQVESVAIAPCGLIANSLFNDTLTLFSIGENATVNVTGRGIAWKSDHSTKFRNPSGNITEAFANYPSPPNWQRSADELDPSDPDNNGFQNEDFIVWMRTAALSTFRKLYRKIPAGLEKGDYRLIVTYDFPTHAFSGKKFLVLNTISWLGGRNTFLGIAYLVVGSISLAVSLAFVFLSVLNSGSWHVRQRDVL